MKTIFRAYLIFLSFGVCTQAANEPATAFILQGKTEAELIQAWGKPTGRMELDDETILTYDKATITIKGGKAIQCKARDFKLEQKTQAEAERNYLTRGHECSYSFNDKRTGMETKVIARIDGDEIISIKINGFDYKIDPSDSYVEGIASMCLNKDVEFENGVLKIKGETSFEAVKSSSLSTTPVSMPPADTSFVPMNNLVGLSEEELKAYQTRQKVVVPDVNAKTGMLKSEESPQKGIDAAAFDKVGGLKTSRAPDNQNKTGSSSK